VLDGRPSNRQSRNTPGRVNNRLRATVVVCTFNRAPVLEQCLRSLDTQVVEGEELEVLVVDNASTDHTPALLRDWMQAGRGRRVIREPRLGLAHARNAALHACERDVVIFTDDDALVPPTWAKAHLDVYRSSCRIGSVGGPVGLVWPYGYPDWMTDALMQWFSAVDLGDETGPYPEGHEPYGTNMSVWRDAAAAVGGFDVRLGRQGRRLLSSEERDLNRRLVSAGWRLYYSPAAAVVQQVLPERLSRRWLLRRGWAQGISTARFDMIGQGQSPRALMMDALADIKGSAQAYRRRRAEGDHDLAALVVLVAHLGVAVELVRSRVVGMRPP